MSLKKAIKNILDRAGLMVVKKGLVDELRNMEAPPLLESHLPNCKVYPNRYYVLSEIPQGGVIAEIGVAYGDFSQALINQLHPQKFVAIDLFMFEKNEEPWGRNNLATSGLTHEEYYKDRFKHLDQVEVVKGYSWDKLADFEDEYFDYIYLDADHSYEEVKKDIAQIKKKLKTGGFVQFNDYTTMAPTLLKPYGVAKAVNELLLEGGYEMTAFCLEPGGYHDVVLKKIG